MIAPWPAAGLVKNGVMVRTYLPQDTEPLWAQLREPSIRRWAPIFDVPTLLDARRRVANAVLAAENGDWTALVIADAARPDVLLGTLDIRNDRPGPVFSVRDVGYAVTPAARGRGLASTALDLLTTWLLSPEGGDIYRVQLDHAVDNLASCRTALRAGFVQEGRRACYLPLQVEPTAPIIRHDICLHGRIRPFQNRP